MNRIRNLMGEIGNCSLCHSVCGIDVPALEGSALETGDVRYLIVGEQPDHETFTHTGRNGIENPTPEMERLRGYLAKAGIDRTRVLYTTSVMCLPRDPNRRPGRPTAQESKNCTRHLTKLIELVRPRVIIPLGHTAIQSIQSVYRDWTELRQFILNYDVGKVIERNGVAVYPLYHPSRSAVNARSELRQTRDWQRLPTILNSPDKKGAPTG
jgi:DNA polymerase